MKANVAKAFEALKEMNAPVFEDGGSCHFRISGECNFDPAYGNNYWADYYVMTDGADTQCNLDDFGVHEEIQAVLQANGLYAEWNDAGTLHVYDA